MAFRATSYWRSMLKRLGLGGSYRWFASSTAPKFTPSSIGAAHAHHHHHHHHHHSKYAVTGEYAPVCIVMGMVLVAVTMAAHTAKQQIMHSPAVYFNKKKRESIPEVENPDGAVASADKFVNKSFLRKVAHIQEKKPTVQDPVRPDPFNRPRNAQTLKTVGVDPSCNIPTN